MDLEYKITSTKYDNIKQILKEEFGISSRLFLKLKRENHIYLNGKPILYDKILSSGDIIGVDLNFIEDNSNIVSTKMDLNILYEDNYMLILDKPSGIAVHPSLKHFETSLSNGVKYYFNSIDLKRKIRIVNRLDKDTSGIVIFAKNEYIQEDLISQMKNGIFQKEYIGILVEPLENKFGTIDAPIARKENSIIERCIDKNGQPSITHYDVIKENNNLSLVHFKLETGRTHQIRVHSKFINHPILGDTLYGTSSNLISRQALHSYKIKFIHPVTKKEMVIVSPIPKDIENAIRG